VTEQLQTLLTGAGASLGLTLLTAIARLLSVLVGKVRALEQFLHGYGTTGGLLKQLAGDAAAREKIERDVNAAFARVRTLEEALRAAEIPLPPQTPERSS
jgi:hypothetical protein